VDLSALARELAGQLREAQPERRATFVIGEGLEAFGDPLLLRLALENLLDNAFKFTADRPRAQIEFGAQEQNGQKAYFVGDNGVGFDMAYADNLFVPFQRLHNRSQFPGSGIGLATVQRIVHRHGGRIWGQGRVDRGATFYFTLTTPSGPL
jgi:light-regulated signal transduction histidine kinase (bacteriophytochrome)